MKIQEAVEKINKQSKNAPWGDLWNECFSELEKAEFVEEEGGFRKAVATLKLRHDHRLEMYSNWQ